MRLEYVTVQERLLAERLEASDCIIVPPLRKDTVDADVPAAGYPLQPHRPPARRAGAQRPARHGRAVHRQRPALAQPSPALAAALLHRQLHRCAPAVH